MKRLKAVFYWVTLLLVLGGLIALLVATLSRSTGGTSVWEIGGLVLGGIVPSIAFLYSQVQKRSLAVSLWENRIRSCFSSRTLVPC